MTASAPLPLTFLCGHRKSGTTMLANLLDGHPALSVYPTDLALLYGYFPEFVRAHDPPQERRARLKTMLFDDFKRRQVAEGLDAEKMSERFFDGLQDDDLGEPKFLIRKLMQAFRDSIGEPQVAPSSGVFKETSIEIYAAEIMKWFPEARFIHLVRDPRDNFAALATGVEGYYSRMGEDHNKTLASLLNRVRIGFRMARINSSQFGDDRYRVLRFEDLTASPKDAMQAVADFLGVEFHQCMLTPTTLGKPAGGNAFDGVANFSVSARNVQRWRERISPEDAQIIEFHLADEMEEFGYQPAFSKPERASAAAEFYKWQNYTYFYSDRFAHGVAR
jgi:hypothetical protein